MHAAAAACVTHSCALAREVRVRCVGLGSLALQLVPGGGLAVPGVVGWVDGYALTLVAMPTILTRDLRGLVLAETLDWPRRLGVHASACSESRYRSRLHRDMHSPRETVRTLRCTSAVGSCYWYISGDTAT